MAEKYRGRDKTVIKISREGLCEENLATHESKRISRKAGDAVLEKNPGVNTGNTQTVKDCFSYDKRRRYLSDRKQPGTENSPDVHISVTAGAYAGRADRSRNHSAITRPGQKATDNKDYKNVTNSPLQSLSVRLKAYQSAILPDRKESGGKTSDVAKTGVTEISASPAYDKRLSGHRAADKQKFSKGRKWQAFKGYGSRDRGSGADRNKPPETSHRPVFYTGAWAEKSDDDRAESQTDDETQEILRVLRSAERDAIYRSNRSLAANSYHKDKVKPDGLHDRPGMSEFRASNDKANTYEEKRTASRKSQKKAAKKHYQRQYRERNRSSGIQNRIKEVFGLPHGGVTAGSSGRKSRGVHFPVSGKGLKHALIILLIFLVVLITIIGFALIIFQGGMTAIASTTYQSTDEEIHAAEDAYKALEDALDKQINKMEETHPGYDEYRYQVDEINHNPFHLISYLTVLYGEFTLDDVREALDQLFQAQYTLNVWETTEVRKRKVTDPDTGEETEKEYDYRILNIALTNHGIDHVARQSLTEDQYRLYQAYNSTSGNRPDLFDASQLPFKVTPGDEDGPTPEALSDEKFGRMYDEAKKYLGYPYVWGGSSPSTSFDCSGFVSWVINNSGNGWNVGRCTAERLRGKCSYVSADEAKPGDLIFFQGTYNTRGASHVGIVIGNGKMIHCGKPIQIASYKTSYWNRHFYQFGRIR